MRRVVTAVDSRLPIDRIDPLSTLMWQFVRKERLLARLATGFGLGALLLAAIGLYGVMTYTVTRRTGEIGLRVALGAQRSQLVRLVISDALHVVLLGFAAGVLNVVRATKEMNAATAVPADMPALKDDEE